MKTRKQLIDTYIHPQNILKTTT